MKLFKINGVNIKALGKLKMAWNAVLLNTGKTPFKYLAYRIILSAFFLELYSG